MLHLTFGNFNSHQYEDSRTDLVLSISISNFEFCTMKLQPTNLFSASLILRMSIQTAQGTKYLAIQDRWYTLTDAPCADLDMFAMKLDQYGEYGKIYPLYPKLAHCNGRAYVFDISKWQKQVNLYRYNIDFLPNNFCNLFRGVWNFAINQDLIF